MTDHVVPFQFSTRAVVSGAIPDEPTATQLVGLTHETPKSVVCGPKFGLGVTDHVVPFHFSTKDPVGEVKPTATQLVGLTHETPESQLSFPTLGLGVTDHVVPFQVSTRVR